VKPVATNVEQVSGRRVEAQVGPLARPLI
jgi:hypothetical protein